MIPLGSVSVYDSSIFGREDFADNGLGRARTEGEVADDDGTVDGTDSPKGLLHCVNWIGNPRQIRVGPKLRTVCRSVVTLGIVQVRVTRSPLRAARRSVGGFGNSSDGGCGGPIVAHAVIINGAPSPSKNVSGERFMEKKPDYQNSARQPLSSRKPYHPENRCRDASSNELA